MDLAASQLNLRDLSTRIAMEMMRHVRDESTKAYGPAIIEWARSYGAQFTDEAVALDNLRRAMPEPANWPAVEVTPASKISLNNDAPKVVKPRTTPATPGKTVKDFQKISVPEGVTAPLCMIEKKNGANKGQICGKTAAYHVAAHRPNEVEACRNLKCNHCFCGIHIKTAETDEASAYQKLADAANGNGNPVSINVGGQKESVKPETQAALDEEKGKQFGNAVLNKLLNKVSTRVDGQK